MKCKYFLKIKYCAKTYVLKLCFISMTSLHISFHLQKTETFISTLPSNNTIYNDGIIQNIYIDGKCICNDRIGKLLCILIIQLVLKVSNNNPVWR